MVSRNMLLAAVVPVLCARLAVAAMPGAPADGARAGAQVAEPAGQDPCPLDAFAWSDPERASLPLGLREVSGLAYRDGSRLLAHDDERGIVAILDAGTGERVGQFTLGPRLPRDDFEGIAIAGDRLYLVTSAGRLYEAPIGEDGQTVAYRVRDTGLGELCELEGLAADPGTRTLLLGCKVARTRELRGQVVVFAWSLERGQLDGVRFRAPAAAFGSVEGPSFRPSAVEWLPGGNLLLLSGADRAIAAVAPPDTVRCTRQLPAGHRQAEGLALLPGGSLAIADEGDPGRLTLYERRSR